MPRPGKDTYVPWPGHACVFFCFFPNQSISHLSLQPSRVKRLAFLFQISIHDHLCASRRSSKSGAHAAGASSTRFLPLCASSEAANVPCVATPSKAHHRASQALSQQRFVRNYFKFERFPGRLSEFVQKWRMNNSSEVYFSCAKNLTHNKYTLKEQITRHFWKI